MTYFCLCHPEQYNIRTFRIFKTHPKALKIDCISGVVFSKLTFKICILTYIKQLKVIMNRSENNNNSELL